MKKALVLGLLFGLATVFTAEPAFAYNLNGYKYASTNITYNEDSLPSGYNGPAINAAQSWNSVTPVSLTYASYTFNIDITGSYYGSTDWNALTTYYTSGSTMTGDDVTANYT